MFAKEALRQFPVLRQLTDLLHHGVNPVDAAWLALILDSVASLGVVHHHLAGAAPSFGVNLEEDYGTAVSDTEPVVIDEALHYERVEDCVQELHEVGLGSVANGSGHDVRRDYTQRAWRLRCRRLV